MSDDLSARLSAAVLPLLGSHGGVVLDELRRLSIDAERVAADIAEARVDAAWRALLERDVREVAYFVDLIGVIDSAPGTVRRRHLTVLRAQTADCLAWLTRARTVLG